MLGVIQKQELAGEAKFLSEKYANVYMFFQSPITLAPAREPGSGYLSNSIRLVSEKLPASKR